VFIVPEPNTVFTAAVGDRAPAPAGLYFVRVQTREGPAPQLSRTWRVLEDPWMTGREP